MENSNLLAFSRGLETIADDSGKMNENVFRAVGGVMKPKPLLSLNHLT